jgi:hypothetical protein
VFADRDFSMQAGVSVRPTCVSARYLVFGVAYSVIGTQLHINSRNKATYTECMQIISSLRCTYIASQRLSTD